LVTEEIAMIYTTYTLIIIYGIGTSWSEPRKVEIPAIATEQACNTVGPQISAGYHIGGEVKWWCVPVTKPVPPEKK
jgi:hypothetical protein